MTIDESADLLGWSLVYGYLAVGFLLLFLSAFAFWTVPPKDASEPREEKISETNAAEIGLEERQEDDRQTKGLRGDS